MKSLNPNKLSGKWLIPVLVLALLIITPWIITGARLLFPPLIPDEPPPVVTIIRPKRQDLIRTIELPGSFRAYEETVLHAKTSGFLESIRVDTGDPVQKGQVLARISSPEVAQHVQQARARYNSAMSEWKATKAQAVLDEKTFERYEAIQNTDPALIAGQEVDLARSRHDASSSRATAFEAQVAGAREAVQEMQALAAYTLIRAPFDGVVTERHVDPGAFIEIGKNVPILTIANSDRLRLHVNVPERDARFIKPGSAVRLQVDALPQEIFTGSITRFASALNSDTRTMLTEIVLPNVSHRILPGMYAHAVLNLETHPKAIVLPAEAVVATKKETYVLVVTGKAKVHKIPVKTGINDGKTVEIVHGLTGNERIIFNNQTDLETGMTVKTKVFGQ